MWPLEMTAEARPIGSGNVVSKKRVIKTITSLAMGCMRSNFFSLNLHVDVAAKA